ncbi:MAG: helix-turn-helix domain-containing protein, partial [Catalinimonas sp.]
YRLLTAPDGARGLEAARRHLPDLVLSDVMMPHMDGLEMCRRLKEDELTSHVPVVLLTAKAGAEHQVSGLEAGADLYIEKPFDPRVLRLLLNNLLAQRARLKEVYRNSHGEVASIDLNTTDRAFLDRAYAVLEAHYREPTFGPTPWAEALNFSARHLSRKLNALLQRSPGDVLKEYRLDAAKTLLRCAPGSISEVVYGVGYEDHTLFSRHFKARFGQTPSAFRDARTATSS